MALPRILLLVFLVGRVVLGFRVHSSDVLLREKNSAQAETRGCSEYGWSMGQSREADMSHMALGIYEKARQDEVREWTLELVGDTTDGHEKKFGGRDFFGIYRRDQECVLSIAGSANTGDWINDFQFVHYDMPYCGIEDIHYGFFSQWSDTIWSRVWGDKFVPFFETNCTDGISVVGHSLGGAVASVMATCALTNSTALDGWTLGASSKMTRNITIPWLDANNQTHFNQTWLPIVSELWTFGAPGIAQERVTNQSAEDGIFQGARFFIEDERFFDPVPWSGHLTGLLHPNMKAVRLFQDTDGFCKARQWDPEDDMAASAPNKLKLPNPNLHSYSYEPRVADAFP